jgi:hypothetical protein
VHAKNRGASQIPATNVSTRLAGANFKIKNELVQQAHTATNMSTGLAGAKISKSKIGAQVPHVCT